MIMVSYTKISCNIFYHPLKFLRGMLNQNIYRRQHNSKQECVIILYIEDSIIQNKKYLNSRIKIGKEMSNI